MGHGLDALLFVVPCKTHPAHPVAADVDRDLADGLQQRRLGGGAHQRFVAGTEQALGAAHACQFALGAQPFGHIGGQHLPRGPAVEADAAGGDFYIDELTTLGDVAADHRAAALVHVDRIDGQPDRCAAFLGPQVRHGHGQQLCLGVAVVQHHRLVHGLQFQGFLVVHPHRVRVVTEQHAVLLFGHMQPVGDVAQLHHRPERFRQDFQVRHLAPRERIGHP